MSADDEATRDALRRMESHGSDLSRPLPMDFFVAVPDQKSGELVAAGAAALGFSTEVAKDDEGPAWTCYCMKVITPSYETVRAIEGQLDGLARPVGGHSDGFGSFGNAPEGE